MLPDEFIVRQFEPKHLLEMNIRKEQYDALEFLINAHTRLEDYATMMFQKSSYAVTIYYKGKILLCGGIVHMWPGVGDGWFFFDEDTPEIFKEIPKTFVKGVRSYFNWVPLQRIQTIVDPEFPTAAKFLRFMGFDNEGIMRKYHSNGNDYYRFALIKEI